MFNEAQNVADVLLLCNGTEQKTAVKLELAPKCVGMALSSSENYSDIVSNLKTTFLNCIRLNANVKGKKGIQYLTTSVTVKLS